DAQERDEAPSREERTVRDSLRSEERRPISVPRTFEEEHDERRVYRRVPHHLELAAEDRARGEEDDRDREGERAAEGTEDQQVPERELDERRTEQEEVERQPHRETAVLREHVEGPTWIDELLERDPDERKPDAEIERR